MKIIKKLLVISAVALVGQVEASTMGTLAEIGIKARQGLQANSQAIRQATKQLASRLHAAKQGISESAGTLNIKPAIESIFQTGSHKLNGLKQGISDFAGTVNIKPLLQAGGESINHGFNATRKGVSGIADSFTTTWNNNSGLRNLNTTLRGKMNSRLKSAENFLDKKTLDWVEAGYISGTKAEQALVAKRVHNAKLLNPGHLLKGIGGVAIASTVVPAVVGENEADSISQLLLNEYSLPVFGEDLDLNQIANRRSRYQDEALAVALAERQAIEQAAAALIAQRQAMQGAEAKNKTWGQLLPSWLGGKKAAQ